MPAKIRKSGRISPLPAADFSKEVNLVAQVTDCFHNAVFPAKKEYFSAKSAFVCRGGKAEIESEVLKKRPLELSVWDISPLLHPFLCGKNGISLRKEIFFLPQRREFLAAKKFPGVWKAGKNGASGGFFLLVGDFPRANFACLFVSLSARLADAGSVSFRTVSLDWWQRVMEAGLPLSSCVHSSPRDSHISVRLCPCARPCDSRDAGFDVLTKWHFILLPSGSLG